MNLSRDYEEQELYSPPRLEPEEIFGADFGQYSRGNGGERRSSHSKFANLIIGSLLLVYFIFLIFSSFPLDRLVEGKSSSNELGAESAELEQIHSILKYLVDKSKSYDEVIELAAAKSPFSTNGNEGVKIATVIVPKANLRPIPSLNSTPLMTVPAGAQLLVEREKTDWLKVFAPTGEITWVSRSVVELN